MTSPTAETTDDRSGVRPAIPEVLYRTVFDLPSGQGARSLAETETRAWLISKSTGRHPSLENPQWAGEGVHDLGRGCVLTVAETDSALMLQLDDRSSGAHYRTTLWATDPKPENSGRGRIAVEAWGVDDQGVLLEPGTPRVVRQILRAATVDDGTVPILPEPVTVRPFEVDRLVSFLLDPQRSISLVVAGPVPGLDEEDWTAVVNRLVRDSVGVSSAFVLTDDSLAEFNRRVGHPHSAERRAVRTYLPGVDLQQPSDGLRHRVLRADALARGAGRRSLRDRLIRLHASAAREARAAAPVATSLLDAQTALQRRARRLISEEGTQRRRTLRRREMSVPSPETSTPDAAVVSAEGPPAGLMEGFTRLVRRFLGRTAAVTAKAVDELTDFIELLQDRTAEVESQADQLLTELASLDTRRADQQHLAEDREIELAAAEGELQEIRRRAAYLEQRLHEQHIYDNDVPAEEGSEQPPDSCQELVLRLAETDSEYADLHPHIVWAGDVERALDRAEEVDRRDTLSRYPRLFWEEVLVLHDYVVARKAGFAGDVHLYLTSTVDGRKCAVHKHRPRESEQVRGNPAMRLERTFAVPAQVSADEVAFMDAHFAPTTRDGIAPRMHYLDDVSGTGKVYIGYVGLHLTVARHNG